MIDYNFVPETLEWCRGIDINITAFSNSYLYKKKKVK